MKHHRPNYILTTPSHLPSAISDLRVRDCKPRTQSGIINPRVLLACILCLIGVSLSMLSFGATPSRLAQGSQTAGDWTKIGSYLPPSVRYESVMVFDAARGVTLLYGGKNGGIVGASAGITGDTWTFDRTRWNQLQPSLSPGPRAQASGAYDAAHQNVVLFGGYFTSILGDTWVWDGNDWSRRQPQHSPPARKDAAMAYDGTAKRVVLFGGIDVGGNALGDTWTWDGADWTQEQPPVSPPPRNSFGFADGDGTPVLFGGSNSTIIYFGDTWTWDGNNHLWTPHAGAGPDPRANVGMASSEGTSHQTLLHGGVGPTTVHPDGNVYMSYYDDTWAWDGSAWQKLTAPALPRLGFGMVWDSIADRFQIFGGSVQTRGWANDTWGFDGATWIEEARLAPNELVNPMFAREPGGSAVLFGGQTRYGPNTIDTWRWSGTAWELLAPTQTPAPRQSASFVFDETTQSDILFGGLVDTWVAPRQIYQSAETWRWDGADWTQLDPGVSPPARYQASMAYDAARSLVVLFGGTVLPSGGPADFGFGDTWTFDGSSWTQQHPDHSPPPRFAAAMTYDPFTRTIVLFGGNASETQNSLSDTWTWDGTDWTEQHPATVPTARSYATMSFDQDSASAIMFGGCAPCFGSPNDETWAWDGSDWHLEQPLHAPSATMNAASVGAEAGNSMLLFGGRRNPMITWDSGTDRVNDLWAFGAAQPLIPTGVVSRKIHSGAGTFDINLPLAGSPGIECRSGGANGNYALVFIFANTLNASNPVSGITATATTSSGTQTVTASGNIGTDTHEYFVSLTGVPNASHVTVTLNGVTDSANNFGDVSARMDVLLGDVNSTGRTDSGDVTQVRTNTVSIPDQQTFRFDVNTSGRIDAGDVTVTRNASVTVLP
jgi:hypothetical protein